MRSLLFRDPHTLWGEGLFLSHVVVFNQDNTPYCLKCGVTFQEEIKSSCLPEDFDDLDEIPPTLWNRVCNFFKKK